MDTNFGSLFANKLKVLDLSHNLLAALPETFTQLKELELLDISHNLNLELTSEFWNLVGLKTFAFEFGTVTELPSQIGSWARLESLDLTNNRLTEFPSILLKLSQLIDLDLGWMDIGSIPEEFNIFQNLQYFGCPGCGLTQFPTLNGSSLEDLDLGDNYDLLTVNILSLTNLQSLRIACETLVPSSLASFTSLSNLFFSGQRFSQLPDLPQSVTRLFLVNTSVSSWPPSFTSGIPFLKEFLIFSQKEPIEFPHWFFQSSATSKSLSLDGDITGVLPCSFPNTSSLTLTRTQLVGSLCEDINLMSQSLEVINLQQNPFIGGVLPTQLLLLQNLEDIVLENNNFEPELSNEFEDWFEKTPNLSRCSLTQSSNEFRCESQSLLGQEQICNIQCSSPYNLEGVWINEDTECKQSYFGLPWTSSKVSVFGNGTGSTVVEYFDGCGGTQMVSLKLEGSFQVANITQVREAEYLIDVNFNVSSQSVFIFSTRAQLWFQRFCPLANNLIGVWNDVSHTPCQTSALGINAELPDLNNCSLRFDTWFVNFMNSSLMTGQGVFLGITKSTSLCGSNSRPEPNNQIKLRRNWECEDEFLSSCSPVCGDGVVLSSEQCDDGNSVSGDGCSSNCFIEYGWRCSGGMCSPVCGDGLIVSFDDCDSFQSSSSSQRATWWIVILLSVAMLMG